MQQSQKSKTRRPIFGKKQQPQQQIPDRLTQTLPSFLQDSIQIPLTHSLPLTHNLSHLHSTVSPLCRPQSVAKITFPITTRVFSPPRVVNLPNSKILAHRPLTPALHSATIFNKPANAPQVVFNRQFCQTQPLFHQNLSNYAPQRTSAFEERPFHQKLVRSNQLKPTVVAVERVMKTIGENSASRELTFLKPTLQGNFTHQVVEPQKIKVYDRVNRRHGEYDKMWQLQSINSILSRKYDLLYEQVLNLKQQNSMVVEQSLDDSTFIHKAANHFENLLSVEMHKAMNEIQSVHKIQKRSGSKHKWEPKHSYFR